MCAKKIRQDTGPEGQAWPHSQTTVGPPDLRPRAKPPQTEVVDDGLMDDEIALRVMRSKMTWKEWLLYDFLRYWYGVGALALLTFAVTHVAWEYHVRDALGLAVLAVGGFALAALEFVLYRAIWPRGAFTQGWPAGKRLRMAVRKLRWRL